jgi:hypothetical protein
MQGRVAGSWEAEVQREAMQQPAGLEVQEAIAQREA